MWMGFSGAQLGKCHWTKVSLHWSEAQASQQILKNKNNSHSNSHVLSAFPSNESCCQSSLENTVQMERYAVPQSSWPCKAALLKYWSRKKKLRLWAESVGHWNEDESLWTLTAQVKWANVLQAPTAFIFQRRPIRAETTSVRKAGAKWGRFPTEPKGAQRRTKRKKKKKKKHKGQASTKWKENTIVDRGWKKG